LKISLLSEILRERTVLKEGEGSWYSDGQIKGDEMDGECSTYGGEKRDVYRVLVGKPARKRSLGRPRRRREDNIKKDLQEVGCGVIDWIELVQDMDRWRKLVNAIMNLWVP